MHYINRVSVCSCLKNLIGLFVYFFIQGHMADLVQEEVSKLMRSAMAMALLVVRSNPTALEGLGAQLEGKDQFCYHL
jgi:hypothetical protein